MNSREFLNATSGMVVGSGEGVGVGVGVRTTAKKDSCTVKNGSLHVTSERLPVAILYRTGFSNTLLQVG